MIEMTLGQAADILGSKTDHIIHPVTFRGISIDTRTLQPGNLFVAIKGDNRDGHDFIEEAKQKGAAAALVSHQTTTTIPQLQVKDTTQALGQLSAAWRHQFHIPFVAVTGSNGKTTVKNMITSIMTAACQGDTHQVLSTQGTLNNQWGLPLTLARLNAQHRYADIEMGMNHFGEIEYLTQLTHPDIAVITNAAACHLEGVGNIQGVARAKAEIFAGLAADGIAILNRDDAFFSFWREIIGKRHYLSFGFHPDAHIRATIGESSETEQQIVLQTPQGDQLITLHLLGKHNVMNALAAAATGIALNMPLEAIKIGLESLSPAPGRLTLHTLNNGVKIIDDTYNANPFSLQAAINTLAAFTGKRILVLGDMRELGEEAKALHYSAGESIRQAGIDFLFTFGDLSENTAHAFGEGAYHFNEQDKLINALKPFLYNQTTILIKGSRSMHMEKVVTELVQ